MPQWPQVADATKAALATTEIIEDAKCTNGAKDIKATDATEAAADATKAPEATQEAA